MPVLKGSGGTEEPSPGPAKEGTPPATLDHILSIELVGVVVLAERSMRVEEVLNLHPGAIIEFPKSAEDLLDFQVNGRGIARGETVKDGEKFGLQIKQISRMQDTVRAMGQG